MTQQPGTTAELDQLVHEAVALRRAGQHGAARERFEQALVRSPTHPGALTSYAMLQLERGELAHAIALARRAVASDPRRTSAHHVLGQSLCRAGALDEGIAALERAVALRPDAFDAHMHLGLAYGEVNDWPRAEAQLARASELAPTVAAVAVNLGNVQRRARRFDAAAASYRRAITLDPTLVQAHGNLGALLSEAGDTEAGLPHLERALGLAPTNPSVISNTLLALSRSDRLEPAAIAAVHRKLGAVLSGANVLEARLDPTALARRRLRVAYLSSDFVGHAVALFFEPLLREHDRARFEIHCLHTGRASDEVTARFAALAEHFAHVAGMSDDMLAQHIRDLGIDVLVDLNGHTANNRLPVFARRAAPVQVTWLGYLATTGLTAMDFRLTDARADPPGMTEAWHTERLWRLPNSLWCYQPHAAAPAAIRAPRAPATSVTFGNLNSPSKTSPAAIRMWAQILRAVPEARLVLIASPVAQRVSAVQQAFAQQGVAPERIEQVPMQPTRDYLDLYRGIDIALDPWPYAGGTTTCDALWMGVPVVTLATNRSFSRSGASILGAIGAGELVTDGEQGYVATAVALARDPPRIERYRATLRERMASSPLCDAPTFARDVEVALVAMARERAA